MVILSLFLGRKDVVLPPSLLCEDVKPMLVDTVSTGMKNLNTILKLFPKAVHSLHKSCTIMDREGPETCFLKIFGFNTLFGG